LLCEVASHDIPIIYLSAGSSHIRAQNLAFLGQLPPGVLIDNPSFTIFTFDQPGQQGDFKLFVLRELRAAYPEAKLFGLGDDKYGDAVAYTEAGAKPYIHHVAYHPHLPPFFSGVLFRAYTSGLQQQMILDLEKRAATR